MVYRQICQGIRSAERRPLLASGLQTDVYGCIRFGDRGLREHLVDRQSLWEHRVCIQWSVGKSGMQTEFCGGMDSADSGLWWLRVCRKRFVWASGLQTEVCGGIGSADRGLCGHRYCRQSSVGTSGPQTEVCGGIEYGDRDLRGHLVGRQTITLDIGSADRGLWVH